jgi:hypothetical protein
MEILQEAEVFEKTKMSNMSNSDRVTASREAKRLLAINKIYMNKEATLMDLMKRLTSKKKIDIRLKGRPNLMIVLIPTNKQTKWKIILKNNFSGIGNT